MKKQMIIMALAIVLSFCTMSYADSFDKFDGMQFAEAGKLLIERRGTYTLPSEWIYEGVVMDEEGKFPQKKYTLVKDLDESILYGNRNIYDEMKARVPFLSKDSFKSTFSNQDLAQIIASASGGETAEVDYGENHFYETVTTQQANQNGNVVYVTSIIDMFFEEEYIHSFSYSYKSRTDGLSDYKAMLASFKLGADEQPKKSKQEQLLEQERQEQAKKEQERLQQEQAEILENATPEPTTTPEPTVVPSPTPEPTVEPVVTDAIGEEFEPVETIEQVAEQIIKNETSGEVVIESEIYEEIISSGEVFEQTTNNEKNIQNNEVLEVVETPEPVITEVRKPIKKKSTLEVVLSIPAVRKLIVFCIIFDITITLIIKKRKKKKAQEAMAKEDTKGQSEVQNTDENK